MTDPVAKPDPVAEPDPAAEQMRTERTSGVVKAGSVMAVGTVVSRLTGFISKAVIFAFLGAWVVNDSYRLADTLPNILFELLVGGVLTSVAVPLLSRARKDPDGGTAYTQQLMTLTVVTLAIVTAAAVAAAPVIIWLYTLFSSGNADPVTTTHLAYLLFPEIFFYGLAALFQAILNTKERFAAPAWAPTINNLVVIGVGVALFTTSGGIVNPDHGITALSRGQFLLLGLGTTFGIVLQAAVLLPSLRRCGFRLRWRWGLDSRMAQAGKLMAWVVLYTLISQVGYIVTSIVTHHARTGLYGLYTYGSMLFQMPYGILGVSLLTAIMPRMSRHAAAGEVRAVKHDMSVANRLSTVALLPVTAAMIALAVPIVTVTAHYGRVETSDARILSLTLAAFAIGLLPLAITLVQARVFYAMADGRTPALINGVMVAVRVPLLLACLALPVNWVVPGTAAAMSISYVVGVVAGQIWLRVRFGRMGFSATLDTIGRTALAAAAGGAAAWWVTARLLPVDIASLGGAVVALIVGVIVGLVIVIGGLLLLRVDEMTVLQRRLLARFGHGSSRDDGSSRGDGGSRGDGSSRDEGARQHQHDEKHEQEDRQGHTRVTDHSTRDEGDGDGSGGDARHVPPGDEPLTAGVIVGERYRLTRLVATDRQRHQFWQARDTVLPRDMAITIIPDADPSSTVVTQTLRVGRLGHGGLPQTLDMGAVGTSSYLAGQWVDGATLPDLLSDGPLEPAVARRVTNRLASSIADLHQAGMALGHIHPSLVRVNYDGQVRLSHAVARTGATPQDDARALGAILYLMLTDTWPLALADGPKHKAAAVERDDLLVAAHVVNHHAPEDLSDFAQRALGVGSGGSIDAAGLAAATRDSDGSGSASGGRGSHSSGRSRPPRGQRGRVGQRRSGQRGPGRVQRRAARSWDDPVDETVRRDRRLKMSIAGAMLVVLAVLMVIMGSSITKQFLANIVAPINASDHHEITTTNTATTTRTVGTTSSSTGGETGGTTSTGSTGSTGTTTSGTGTPKPVSISSATVFDPQGTPPKDYVALVDRAFDGDSSSYWPTWVYKQQFGPGGIKDGVGLLLTLGKSVTPTQVTITTATPGTEVEIRSADSAKPTLDNTTVLGKATLGKDPVSISLSSAPKSQYLLVWLTKIAPYESDTGEIQEGFQSKISEITVTAR